MSNLFNFPYVCRADGKVTFAEVLSTNFKEIFPLCRECTLKMYSKLYKEKILPEIGHRPIEECTEDVLFSALKAMSANKKYSARTLSHLMYLMHRVCEFAEK